VTETLFLGVVETMDAVRPRAEALLLRDDRIVAVGSRAEVAPQAAADAEVRELAEGQVLLPGLIEPHGHPTMTAIVMGDGVIDIRPVVVQSADEVKRLIHEAVAAADPTVGVLANGWDPLLQKGLVEPTIEGLDEASPEAPLVILHNSGHAAYFNSAAAAAAGVDASTPNPPGAEFRRDRDRGGALTGVALEAAAVQAIAAPFIARAMASMPATLVRQSRDANRAGVTTIADLGWDAADAPALAAARTIDGGLSTRLRLYEMSRPGAAASTTLENGDALVRQVGVKVWADGSPWTGNIETSFPYLDTPATRAIGLDPHHRGSSNYDEAQIEAIARQYAPDGWQLACHVHGDVAVDHVLNAWERVIGDLGLVDHRFRLEHVGTMTPEQFARAASLGVTASVFVDHVHYWGDVLVDDLFGERGAAWADAQGAVEAGLAPTFHNDGMVTPLEPLRNMSVAMTRRSRSGRVLDGARGVSIDTALRAHTIEAARQLRSEHEIGSLEPGKLADLVVLGRDPRAVSPEELADVPVVSTWLAGREVFSAAG